MITKINGVRIPAGDTMPEDLKIFNEILANMNALRRMEAWAPFPPFSDGFLNETNPEAKDDHKN